MFFSDTFINILFFAIGTILVGTPLFVLLRGKKKSQLRKEIHLKELSKSWIKKQSGEVHIAELAPIWRDEKPTEANTQNNKFAHEQIHDFVKKHINEAPWFKNANLQKEVCIQILLLLDREGDCSSVVNAAEDVEASWDSNTYTILGKTSLLNHTLNVAHETIAMLIKDDAKHVIPDSVIAALGHDLGKLPSIKGYLYSLGEHPLAAGRVLADIPSFKQLSKKNTISRAIKLHHKRSEGLLGKTLKKADQRARQNELEQGVEQFVLSTTKESKERSLHPSGAKAAWQAQADIYEDGGFQSKKEKSKGPGLVDISKWFDAQNFLDALSPYINRVQGRRFMAFSMADGHVYFQAKAIEEVARKQAEQAGAMDIATMASDDTNMRQILFTVVYYLRTQRDVIARDLIKEQYFGGYFIITMKSSKTLKGFYTPFHAEAFGSIAKMEHSKPRILKNFQSVKPHLNNDNN